MHPHYRLRFKNTQVWKQPLLPTTRNLIRKKHRLWSRYPKRNNREVEKKYNNVRNLVRKETRARTATVQGNIAKSVKENPKYLGSMLTAKPNQIRLLEIYTFLILHKIIQL